MIYAVCSHHCNYLIITVTALLTATVQIIQHQAQSVMHQILIILPLFRNHRSNAAYQTVFYRCVIILPFCIHQIIHCIKHKVHLYWKKHWCVKHQHQCILIWRLVTQHRQCSNISSSCKRMDRLVAVAWEHRHLQGNCHVSIAAVTVIQVLILFQNQTIIGN